MERRSIDVTRLRRFLCYLGLHAPERIEPVAGGPDLEVATCATCGTRRVRRRHERAPRDWDRP